MRTADLSSQADSELHLATAKVNASIETTRRKLGDAEAQAEQLKRTYSAQMEEVDAIQLVYNRLKRDLEAGRDKADIAEEKLADVRTAHRRRVLSPSSGRCCWRGCVCPPSRCEEASLTDRVVGTLSARLCRLTAQKQDGGSELEPLVRKLATMKKTAASKSGTAEVLSETVDSLRGMTKDIQSKTQVLKDEILTCRREKGVASAAACLSARRLAFGVHVHALGGRSRARAGARFRAPVAQQMTAFVPVCASFVCRLSGSSATRKKSRRCTQRCRSGSTRRLASQSK